MRTLRLLILCCATAALTAAGARAQFEAPKPGPEHEHLKLMEGVWDASAKTAAGESKGTMTYKMDLGGLWLASDFQGEFAGQKFTGKGMDSYDSRKKKYVGVWCDSMSTMPLVSAGTYDKEKKTLTMVGDMEDMDGKPAKFKSVTEFKDKDSMVFTMSGINKDGKETVMITITYKRKK